MKYRRFLLALILAGTLAPAGFARPFEVVLLRKGAQTAVWGTDEFEVEITSLGVLRHLKVHGQEIIRQAAALYTSPIPRGGKKGLRTVQGEGLGRSGLTIERPVMSIREERGRRIAEFDHLVANRKVLDGRPLCKVHQTVILSPTGEITVSYSYEWLETLRWRMFSLLLFFHSKNCENRSFMVSAGEVLRAGQLDPGPHSGDIRQIRFLAFDQLTIQPEPGPVHIVWDTPSVCYFSWGGTIQLQMRPKNLPRRVPVLKGQKGRFAFRILLPVSQQ